MSVLVSCILPTGNRLGFARQAIRCFLRQTVDDSELIVVDDGVESAAELCRGLLRVRHVRLSRPTSLGEKLNIAMDHAGGEIIQKLDDDDFYGERFLERAVEALPRRASERFLVAWDCFMVLLASEEGLRFSGHGWAAGGSFCFDRQAWPARPFRKAPRHVDTHLVEDYSPRVIRVCAPEQYIVVRHGRNTWNELSDGSDVDRYFRHLTKTAALEQFIEPIDRQFYQALHHEDRHATGVPGH